MKRVMHRLFWAWDFDREEDWLNAWAARGLALVDVCGIRYVFEEGAPGEYEYRLELLEHTAGSSEGRCYLDFLRDLDIECVGTYGRWAYLRRPRDGPHHCLPLCPGPGYSDSTHRRNRKGS